MTNIDSFLLDKDIENWFSTIDEDYEDYYNSLFDIKIKYELVENDFLISVFKANQCIVAVYSYELYSIKTNQEILDHLKRMVWDLILNRE